MIFRSRLTIHDFSTLHLFCLVDKNYENSLTFRFNMCVFAFYLNEILKNQGFSFETFLREGAADLARGSPRIEKFTLLSPSFCLRRSDFINFI